MRWNRQRATASWRQYCSASILSNVSTVYQRLAKQTAKNPIRWTAVCPINDIPADAPSMRWTGSTVDLIELLYGLDTLKYINGGETGMGELLGQGGA